MKRITLAIMLTVWGSALAACGSSSTSSSGAASSGSGSGSAGGGTANCPAPGSSTAGGGTTINIGSKNFAEEQILAELAKQALTKAGFTVNYSTQEADPQIGQDLVGGKIDMYPQYTGTELQKYDNVDAPMRDLNAAFQQVKGIDDPKGICWTAQAPMNDTNGLAMRSTDSSKFGTTLSSLTTYLQSHSDVKLCVGAEFKSRADGIPGLQATYGNIWGSYPTIVIGGTAEKDLAAGNCDVGIVFTTDSGITANNLTVFQDDKTLFPPDNVGLEVRSTVLQKNPGIATIMNPIYAKITTDEITKLNKLVEIDSKKPADVAAAWLQANGF